MPLNLYITHIVDTMSKVKILNMSIRIANHKGTLSAQLLARIFLLSNSLFLAINSSHLSKARIVLEPEIDSYKKLISGDLVNDSTLATSFVPAIDSLNIIMMAMNKNG